MTTSPQPPPGLTVGGYTLLSRLGEGGMGVVHLAQRPGGERVALKVLRPHIVGDAEARSRLSREVNSLSRIHSRWVAEIVDADPWAEIPYVATRYVPGLSLHDLVGEQGPIGGGDLHWFARGLAEGLASVHEVGVLHRDVKPSNVLMEGRNPILIDFGLARVADDPKLTHTGWLLGTPGYLAPEILHGEDATEASDVHSWGATVAFAGTGRPPFGRGPSAAVMDRVRRGEHDLTGLPHDLRGVVAATLDPDPRRRPSLSRLLAWLRAGPGTVPAPVAGSPLSPLPPRTEPLAVAAPEPHEPTISLFDEDEEDDGSTRRFEEDPWASPLRTSWSERLRRALLLLGLALVCGAAVAAYPWLATAVLLVLTWLLRSASLAASATLDRRRVRGARWYDPVRYLVTAPWHVVRSIGGTVVLALWSLGLAVSAALVCYAVAAGIEATLFGSGLVFALSLWLGPGGSRVRSPLSWIVRPVSAGTGRWLAGLVVVVGAAVALGLLVSSGGVSWAPDDGPPLADLRLPAWWPFD